MQNAMQIRAHCEYKEKIGGERTKRGTPDRKKDEERKGKKQHDVATGTSTEKTLANLSARLGAIDQAPAAGRPGARDGSRR